MRELIRFNLGLRIDLRECNTYTCKIVWDYIHTPREGGENGMSCVWRDSSVRVGVSMGYISRILERLKPNYPVCTGRRLLHV